MFVWYIRVGVLGLDSDPARYIIYIFVSLHIHGAWAGKQNIDMLDKTMTTLCWTGQR